MLGIGNLGRVKVDALNEGSGSAGGMHGNASPSTSNIEHLHVLVGAIGRKVDVGIHLLLVQILVLDETNLWVTKGRDVHLLHVAKGTKVVDNVVVVHNVAKVLAVLIGPISVEENV